jgi:hypothetical protein
MDQHTGGALCIFFPFGGKTHKIFINLASFWNSWMEAD